MIRAIIFDCFGVLTADNWHEFRVQLPREQQSPASELNQQYCRGEISKQMFLETVAKLTSHPVTAIEKLIDNETSKNNQLLEYIKFLRPQYKIGLLSNIASNWIRDYFLTPDEQALFDQMVFSYQVGMTKPDPRIFALICDQLQVEPSEAVMVDDIDRYSQAAGNMGMQTVTYRDLPQFRDELVSIISHT